VTSPLCQSAAFGRIVAPWAAAIAELFAGIVEAILTIAENIRDTLHELSACCRKAGRLLALRLGLSEFNDAVRCALIADIGAALARITGNRRVDLDVSLSAWLCETRQTLSLQLVMPGKSSWVSKILRQRILKGY